LLQPSGATVGSILQAIAHHIESINRMAHLSSVRATTQSTRSGIAIEAEFMLLNSKLSDRANSLQDAEEKIWDLYFAWMGEEMPEEFGVEYETSFSLRDTQRELEQFKTAFELVSDPVYRKHASKIIAQITLNEDDTIQEVWNSIDGLVVATPAALASNEGEHPSLATSSQADRLSHIQEMLMSGYSNDEIMALHPEVTMEDIVAAGADAAANN